MSDPDDDEHNAEDEEDGEAQDFEDGEFPFLKADHPAYKRLQEAWRVQLTGHKERVTLQLREKNEELRKLVKHREEIGVTLYGAQQQLAKLQLQLEQLHDKYAQVNTQRHEDDEALKEVTARWDEKKKAGDDAAKRLAKTQEELNQLNATLRNVQIYNEETKAEIQVARRATYKSEDHIRQIENVKQKQDLLIDSMNEDVRRMTEQRAILDAQLAAQKQETDSAMTTLREASREMEAIEFEKKQLMQQWRSSLVGMQRRDEALQNVRKDLDELAEAESATKNEIRGMERSIRTEQERHEQLSVLKDRNDREMTNLNNQMVTIRQDRERLMDQFNVLKKSMDLASEDTNKLKAEINDHNRDVEVVEKQIQEVSRKTTALANKLEDEMSEQITSDRVASNSLKRMKKISEETNAKELETQTLHNEIARVTVDILNTKAHNQMLKDRFKQLSDDFAERERLIEQYEQEIRKRHHQIEKKQLYVDRLNKDFEEKRTRLEAEAGEADVIGPQEAKLKHMRKAITDLTKQCSEKQKEWIKKQTELLSISSETDRLKASLNDQKVRKMVLEQKKIRIEGSLETHTKEIKELENSMKALHFDMDRMCGAISKHDERAGEVANNNQTMELEFVQKLKEIEASCKETERSIERSKGEKTKTHDEILEAERQVQLWDRKITLEREMQEALDPNVGQADAAAMKKEIHRMELRLEQLKRRQESMIVEMERAVHKRDAIALKYEPKAKKNKQAATTANMKRQIQSLKNNLRLCTQANNDAEQKIAQKEQDVLKLQQEIKAGSDEHTQIEQNTIALRNEVQVASVVKWRSRSQLLKTQLSARRYDELSMGRGPPPAPNVADGLREQRTLRNHTVDILRTLDYQFPQLNNVWQEFYTWLDVAAE